MTREFCPGLKLLCPRGRVQDVLRVIRVADFIPAFEDETQALASLSWRCTSFWQLWNEGRS